jgi:hypothetical protein
VVSAILVGVFDAPAVTSAVPGAVLALILVGLAVRRGVPRASAVPG